MERIDLQLVLAVRERGSLAAAGAALGMAPPAVTKRLAGLEAQLGLRLFQRTTRKVSPTAEGEVMCADAKALLEGFEALEARLKERHADPVGPIRLASSIGFGRLWLGPALLQFQALHPRVTVELQLSGQLPDLASEGFDGAVWLFSAPTARASEWVTRRLARNRRVLVAAPAYLARHGIPQQPADLSQHDCLIVHENSPRRVDVWSLQPENSRADAVRVRVGGSLSANSGELVRDWCLAGRGIMLRSLWDVAPALADGRLVRVLAPWAMHDADVHWLAPARAQTPRRIRLLIDFLAERFGAEPWQARPAPAPKSAVRSRAAKT